MANLANAIEDLNALCAFYECREAGLNKRRCISCFFRNSCPYNENCSWSTNLPLAIKAASNELSASCPGDMLDDPGHSARKLRVHVCETTRPTSTRMHLLVDLGGLVMRFGQEWVAFANRNSERVKSSITTRIRNEPGERRVGVN